MAPRRRRKKNLRYGFLAVAISIVLWAIAHGASTDERGYDIPVAFEDLPDDLVITDQSDDEINVRLQGSRAALRNFSPTQAEYVVNVSGAKAGRTLHEVEVSQIDLPRGVRPVSRSPAQIEVRFERRGRKSVPVRVELEGDPAEGFDLGEVEVEPARVWLTGARSRVLRMTEAVTESIDVSGLDKPAEREVKLSLGSDHVWMEKDESIKVRISVVAQEPADVAAESGDGEGGA
jgi:YbbR domain-containing protein